MKKHIKVGLWVLGVYLMILGLLMFVLPAIFPGIGGCWMWCNETGTIDIALLLLLPVYMVLQLVPNTININDWVLFGLVTFLMFFGIPVLISFGISKMQKGESLKKYGRI